MDELHKAPETLNNLPTSPFSFKLDEGYCDDTKSQDYAGSSMILTPLPETSTAMNTPSLADLSLMVFSMSEAERSGMAPNRTTSAHKLC